jgi:IS5 family transposase
MRNMSFAMTEQQVRDRTKSVTRRLGWEKLKPGELVRAVIKCQGLKKGEHVEELAIIRIVDVRREMLIAMVEDSDYGFAECIKEGFKDHPQYSRPTLFVEMFCAMNRPCEPSWYITRIQFEYVTDTTSKSSDSTVSEASANVEAIESEASLIEGSTGEKT